MTRAAPRTSSPTRRRGRSSASLSVSTPSRKDSPVDTQTGTAQTVKVQLLSGATPVPVSGSLTLDAYQTTGTTTTQVNSRFSPNPLQSIGGQGGAPTYAWSFSVTGNVSGTGYFLRAGNGTDQQKDSNSFAISDCVPNASGNCSSSIIRTGDGTTAGQFSGTGLVGTGVNLSFSGLPSTGAGNLQSRLGVGRR